MSPTATSTSSPVVAAAADGALRPADVDDVVARGLAGDWRGARVVVLVPDHTRTAPLATLLPHVVRALDAAAAIDVVVALGTHPPLDDGRLRRLVGLGERPPTTWHPGLRLHNHAWQDPAVLTTIGTISDDEIRAIAGDVWHPSLTGELPVRINRAVVEADHVVIVGPTFPHEVVGYSGGAKYLFPGISGPEMIDVSHWLGALSGVVDTIGRTDTPPRRLIHRAAAMLETPVTLVGMVVDTANVDGRTDLAGIAVGDVVDAWRWVADLSSRRHVVSVDRPLRRVLSMAPPMYDELWTAAKAMYKLEPALAEGAELVVFAPHLREVSRVHGADIAAVGYHVLPYFLEQWDRFAHVPRAVLAHSSHVRGRGSFVDGVEHPAVTVTLASQIPAEVCADLGLGYLDPATIDVADWTARGDEDVLVVPHAGETLYRVPT